VGTLTDPIVVWPGGWEDTLPQTLKGDIQLQRLVQMMKGEEGEATDAEVCAYLYTVSMCQPIGSEWVRIYQYVLTRYKSDAVPADIRLETLGHDEERMLSELRQWIWSQRLKTRKEKARAERRREREEVAARAPKQLNLGL